MNVCHRRGVRSAEVGALAGSGENTLDVHIEEQIQHDGDGEQTDGDDGNDIDFASNGFQILEKFLLFKGVAVGGFADELQLVFDALEGRILLDELLAQLTVLRLHFGKALLEGGQVDRWRWRCRRWRGSEDIGDGGGDVSVEKGHDLLHEGNCHTEEIDGTLKTGSWCGRGRGWMRDGTSRRWHSGQALRLRGADLLRCAAAGADWKRGSDDALLVSVGELGKLRAPIEASLRVQTFF